MKRKAILIGGIITSILVGGAVVFGAQNSTTVSSTPDAVPAAVAVVPVATTLKTSDISSSTATFSGVINTNGAEVSYWFEYSSDPLLGQILIRKTSRVLLITDSKQFLVEADASGLSSNTKYYYRLVIRNGDDTARGARLSFSTK